MAATTVTDVGEVGAARTGGRGGVKSNGGRGGPGHTAALSRAMEYEPLSRGSDLEEYRAALARLRSGEWDDERWTSFRLRFGIYGQIQPGVQMVRIKIPGGILPFEWARTVAAVNRTYCGAGPGHIHLTTRQDIQLYYVPLDRTPELLDELYATGLTTREACGNTLRNMNGCMLAGVCPREHVDAALVAERLAHAWLRHPLVQHMPRKFKVSVSGCGTDCASSGMHDMGLVATERDGNRGFVVYGGGGTGGVPVAAVKLLDFATEEELPAALEALVRLHQRYSNRIDRNRARIKFLLKRFGEEKFRTLFLEEFERTRRLPQRPWQPLAWREPEEAPEPTSPGGVVRGYDGTMSVVVQPALGLLSSEQLEALTDIGERLGAKEFRATRDQNIILFGLPAGSEGEAVAAVRALGLEIEDQPGDVPDVVSCPGTTTCRLGITNSQNFAREVVEQVRAHAPVRGLSIKLSGCQNGCGLHHMADFGFRGMGKKLDGKNAPHYQIYVGGNPRLIDGAGLAGPIVLARHAEEAFRLLLDGYASGRINGESVRDWAFRIGKDGLREVVEPVLERAEGAGREVFYDWGEADEFTPPEITRGECAASYALDSLLNDLADDGLIGLDRAILAGRRDDGLAFAREGVYYGARRLLVRLGDAAEDADYDEAILRTRAAYAGDREVIAALDEVTAALPAAAAGGDMDAAREAVAVWLDTAAAVVERREDDAFDPAALGDSTGSVMAMLRSQGAVR